MSANKSWSNYGRQVILLNKIRIFGVIFIAVLIIIISFYLIFRVRDRGSSERRELMQVWNDGDYNKAYEISKQLFEEKPVDYFLLSVNGFSAFQLGISQINNQSTLQFIDECIFSLRKAKAVIQKDPQKVKELGYLYYVLGKAYGYKGNEYADLAVKYLEMADALSCDASDIPQFLGIAYAALNDYRSSVEAFSRALNPDQLPTDNLLIAIARSYMAMEEYNMAISYLQHCVSVSNDSNSVVNSKLMLAEIYRELEDYANAEKQYLSILEETGETAEVHFQLGELYNLQGDSTRARSEWRTAYRQDPLHTKARSRLN